MIIIKIASWWAMFFLFKLRPLVPSLQGAARDVETIRHLGPRYGHQGGPSGRDVIAGFKRSFYGHSPAYDFPVCFSFFFCLGVGIAVNTFFSYSVLDGEFRQYKGSRDQDSFRSFVVEKKWQQVEPVPYWKSPNSLQMTVVSTFFKLSQTLRVCLHFLC